MSLTTSTLHITIYWCHYVNKYCVTRYHSLASHRGIPISTQLLVVSVLVFVFGLEHEPLRVGLLLDKSGFRNTAQVVWAEALKGRRDKGVRCGTRGEHTMPEPKVARGRRHTAVGNI